MAFQKWNTSGYPEMETGNAGSTAFTRLKNGVKSALAHLAGTSDPRPTGRCRTYTDTDNPAKS